MAVQVHMILVAAAVMVRVMRRLQLVEIETACPGGVPVEIWFEVLQWCLDSARADEEDTILTAFSKNVVEKLEDLAAVV